MNEILKLLRLFIIRLKWGTYRNSWSFYLGTKSKVFSCTVQTGIKVFSMMSRLWLRHISNYHLFVQGFHERDPKIVRKFHYTIKMRNLQENPWPLYFGRKSNVFLWQSWAVAEIYQQLPHGIELYQAFLALGYPRNGRCLKDFNVWHEK